MISSTRVLPSARTTALCAPAVAKRTIHPQRARQRPFSAATSSPNPFSSSSWSLSANQCQPRPSVSVAAASPSAASSSGAPDGESNDNDWLSQGLLRIVYPAQALLLLLGAASMVALPSGFCELALQSCPLPPPRTAVQLAGAALALPSAASLALAHAASVPGRLSSSTYVALNAGLSLFGLAVAAAASTAVAPSSLPPLAAGAVASFLAPAKFYSYLLLIGPLALAVSCSTAATAYGGQGAGVARALVQAPVVVAAAVQRAISSSPSSPSSRLFGASSAALVALALSGAVASAPRDATSALFLRTAASGALFASVAAAVLSDAASRGRSGASTFVKLKQGAVAGCAAAVGAVVGGAVASSAALSSVLLPAVGVSAALLLFGGTSAWELATVKK